MEQGIRFSGTIIGLAVGGGMELSNIVAWIFVGIGIIWGIVMIFAWSKLRPYIFTNNTLHLAIMDRTANVRKTNKEISNIPLTLDGLEKECNHVLQEQSTTQIDLAQFIEIMSSAFGKEIQESNPYKLLKKSHKYKEEDIKNRILKISKAMDTKNIGMINAKQSDSFNLLNEKLEQQRSHIPYMGNNELNKSLDNGLNYLYASQNMNLLSRYIKTIIGINNELKNEITKYFDVQKLAQYLKDGEQVMKKFWQQEKAKINTIIEKYKIGIYK